jgi:uncharacterized protein (UPF0335 family)
MNTTENNKLIAEFMGFQKTNIGWYDSEETMPPLSNTYDSNTFDEHELAFHEEWDWLMPVVESMESMGYNVSIMRRCWVVVFDTNVMKEIVSIERRASKLKVTYEAVVEFIKQYNK